MGNAGNRLVDVAAILPAAGRGERAGVDKLWVDVGGRPLIAHTMERIAAVASIKSIVVVCPEDRHAAVHAIATGLGVAVTCVPGGARRRDSVGAGLRAVGTAEFVVVHDAARPLASTALVEAVIGAARRHGAATAGIPCVDTIKRVDRGMVVDTPPRDSLVSVQTPQAFATALLRRAHAAGNEDASDDCLLVERLGEPVAVVPGEIGNRKITHAEDLEWLRRQLHRTPA
jgi:2-C-methyl-D-erythritol 4-phosphate cytidylyltransferase